jgi:hypothetical protein
MIHYNDRQVQMGQVQMIHYDDRSRRRICSAEIAAAQKAAAC